MPSTAGTLLTQLDNKGNCAPERSRAKRGWTMSFYPSEKWRKPSSHLTAVNLHLWRSFPSVWHRPCTQIFQMTSLYYLYKTIRHIDLHFTAVLLLDHLLLTALFWTFIFTVFHRHQTHPFFTNMYSHSLSVFLHSSFLISPLHSHIHSPHRYVFCQSCSFYTTLTLQSLSFLESSIFSPNKQLHT